MRRHYLFRSVTSALALALVACGDDAVSPTAGTIQVSLVTVGEAGVEAYELALDGGDPRPVAPGGTLRFTDIDPGDYELRLGLLPEHCIASGANPRTVSLAAGQTAVVEFRVVCDATGSVLVTTRTIGESRDPDGYVLAVSGAQRDVGIEAETRIERVEAGTRTVALFGVAANCTVADGTTREITVAAGDEASVTFEVTCEFIGAVRWDTLPLPFHAQIREYKAIWGSSPSDLFVLGAIQDAQGTRAAIMHYDGRQWTEQAGFPSTRLTGIAGTSPTDVFVVGEGLFGSPSFIVHYDGSQWMETTGPAADDITVRYRGVWQAPTGEAFVCGAIGGDGGSGELLARVDGTAWSQVGLPGLGLGAWMTAVAGTSPIDVWSIGWHWACPECHNAVYVISHWNGTKWTVVGSHYGVWLTGLTALAPNDVWVAGTEEGEGGVLLHWDGTAWSRVSPLETFVSSLSDVWGSSGTDVYVLGSTGLLHYDGEKWTRTPDIEGSQLWGTSRDDVFVLQETRILHGRP